MDKIVTVFHTRYMHLFHWVVCIGYFTLRLWTLNIQSALCFAHPHLSHVPISFMPPFHQEVDFWPQKLFHIFKLFCGIIYIFCVCFLSQYFLWSIIITAFVRKECSDFKFVNNFNLIQPYSILFYFSDFCYSWRMLLFF